jgi:hypothetical protein
VGFPASPVMGISGTSGDQETLDLLGTCSNNATLATTNTADSPDFDTIASTGQLFMGSTSCGNNSALSIGTSLDERASQSAGPGRVLSGTVGRGYSVVLRLKKCDAKGAAIAKISTDQISAASTGCCIGQA